MWGKSWPIDHRVHFSIGQICPLNGVASNGTPSNGTPYSVCLQRCRILDACSHWLTSWRWTIVEGSPLPVLVSDELLPPTRAECAAHPGSDLCARLAADESNVNDIFIYESYMNFIWILLNEEWNRIWTWTFWNSCCNHRTWIKLLLLRGFGDFCCSVLNAALAD